MMDMESAPKPGRAPDPELPPADLWPRIRARLRRVLGENATRDWLGRMELVRIDDRTATLTLPTKYAVSSVKARFLGEIHEAVAHHRPGIEKVVLVVASQAERPSTSPGQSASAPSPTSPDRLVLDTTFTFDHFLPCDSNRLAHRAAVKFAQPPLPSFNPLFLHGQVGVGKTHLLHAIDQQFRLQSPQARTLALSAEQFTHRFVRSLRDNTAMAFKEELRGVDLLLVDDVQFLNGKAGIEREFFHTVSDLITNGKRVAVTADRAPGDMEGFDPRIRSLLAGGLVAYISTASEALRFEFLSKRMDQARLLHSGLECRDTALAFLAKHLVTNFRELNGAVNRLVAEALMLEPPIPITKEFAEDRLQDILRAARRRPTAASIRRLVASYFDIRESDLTSQSRRREIARPRQIGMFLTRLHTDISLTEIGSAYGNRNHSTVLHAIRKIEETRRTDPSLDDAIRELESALGVEAAHPWRDRRAP